MTTILISRADLDQENVLRAAEHVQHEAEAEQVGSQAAEARRVEPHGVLLGADGPGEVAGDARNDIAMGSGRAHEHSLPLRD